MHKRIITSLIIAAMVFSAVPLVLSEESDAVEEYTQNITIYSNNVAGYRAQITYPDPNSYGYVILTEEPHDDAFMRYVSGDYTAMEKYRVTSPIVGDTYYQYCSSYNGSGDVKRFEYQHTYFNLEPGTYKINIAISGNSDIDMRTPNSYSYQTLEPNTDNVVNIATAGSYYFTLDRYYTYGQYVPTEAKITFDKAPITGSETTVTGNQINCGTQYEWYRGETTVRNSSISLGGNYLIEKGSSSETRFLEEVVNVGKTSFNPSDYDMSTYIGDANGTYSIYSLGNSSVTAYIYPQDGGVSESRTIPLTATNSQIDEFSFYMGAYSTFTVAVDYDDSQGYVYLSSSNGQRYVLESGISYSIENEKPGTYEMTVHLYYPPDATAGYIPVEVSVSGIPSPSNNAGVVAVVFIILCVLVFSLLFVSGMKPKWSKK